MIFKLNKKTLSRIFVIAVGIFLLILFGIWLVKYIGKQKNKQPDYSVTEVTMDTSDLNQCYDGLITMINEIYKIQSGYVACSQDDNQMIGEDTYCIVLDDQLKTQMKIESYLLSTVTQDYYANAFVNLWFTGKSALFVETDGREYFNSSYEFTHPITLDASTGRFTKRTEKNAEVLIAGGNAEGIRTNYTVTFECTAEGWRIAKVEETK